MNSGPGPRRPGRTSRRMPAPVRSRALGRADEHDEQDEHRDGRAEAAEPRFEQPPVGRYVA